VGWRDAPRAGHGASTAAWGSSEKAQPASRVEPRDYVDTAAALERYTVEQVTGFARRLDPGLTDRDFAEAAERLDRWGDGVFASFGLGAAGIAELRSRFAAWPRT
jgi:hypothetical protein